MIMIPGTRSEPLKGMVNRAISKSTVRKQTDIQNNKLGEWVNMGNQGRTTQ